MLKPIPSFLGQTGFARLFHALVAGCSATCLLASTGSAVAQIVPASPVTGAVLLAPTWQGLTKQQQESLMPLAANWDTLSDSHKRKWLALAQSFPNLPQAEQLKMHTRMAEWAALKPKDRERARLNFAETKKIAPSERAANWQAYQALSPEDRKELARKAKKKPAGAALAVKPVPPEKLATVPVTRSTADPLRERQSAMQAIDRNTLLPIIPRPINKPAGQQAPDPGKN